MDNYLFSGRTSACGDSVANNVVLVVIVVVNHYLLVVSQCCNSQAIRVEPESADHTLARCRYHRLVAELLALVNVRDVHLDHRTLQAPDAVVQRHARVGVRPCVQHDAVVASKETHFLHLVD